MRALTWLKESFAVRAPERLPRLLAWSTALGALSAFVAHKAEPRATYLPAALASLGLLVALPRINVVARVFLAMVLTGLWLVFAEVVLTLAVVPALLWLVLVLDQDVTPLRAVAFAVGPLLGTLWHAGLVHLVHPWSESTRLLLVALKGSVGLFIGVGLAAAHVEAVGDRIAERLAGRRASEVWQRVRAALSKQPRSAARRQLEARVRALAQQLIVRFDETQAVADAIAVVNVAEVRAELDVLASRAEAATDTNTRRHLEHAMRVHRDTLEQVDGLTRQRERLEARALADLALLERAALCLEVTPASSSLTDVASRLDALAAQA